MMAKAEMTHKQQRDVLRRLGRHVVAIAGTYRWIDENAEKSLMFICYMTMATIIFVEVILRFGFQFQHPWSTTLPIYMFLWVTWLGAAYNVKIRTHLGFDELRIRLGHRKSSTDLGTLDYAFGIETEPPDSSVLEQEVRGAVISAGQSARYRDIKLLKQITHSEVPALFISYPAFTSLFGRRV